MPKINLIRRKIANARRTPTVTGNSEIYKSYYVIARYTSNDDATKYYIGKVEHEGKRHIVKWTKHKSRAMQFHTESGVQMFIHSHLNDRKDVYVVHTLVR